MVASPSPADSSDDPFPIGSLLDGRYRIDGVLGSGGMGRVYRAEHTKIGRSVAIKVLHSTLGRNREASQRFQREAIASGRLDHPNIVGVSDFGVTDDGAPYLVMEILEGESLGDRLSRDKRIYWTQAIDILRGVLFGLRHAHERGVVHRDIKPDNVYLANKDGELVIKILDFGIAKLYAGTDEDPMSTRAGLTVGTPAYLSPEQAVGGAITPASDLYSATVLLYEMLAGRAPFEDKDPLAMLGAHVSRKPPALADIAPDIDIPAPLEDVIQRGLIKTAADRIRSANDYLALLDALSPPLTRASMSLPAADPAARGLASTPLSLPAAAVVAAPTAPAASPTQSAAVQTVRPPYTTTPLPEAARMVALADVEPIPLAWIIRSGVIIALMIIAAVALALAARCTGAELGPRPGAGSSTPLSSSSSATGTSASAASAKPATRPSPPHLRAPGPPPGPPGPPGPGHR